MKEQRPSPGRSPDAILLPRPGRNVWAVCMTMPAIVAIVVGGLLAGLLLTQPSRNVDWYFPRAERAMEVADYQTAATCYSRLLQEHPTDAIAAAGLEASLRGMGQVDEAEFIHRRFSDLGETSPVAVPPRRVP